MYFYAIDSTPNHSVFWRSTYSNTFQQLTLVPTGFTPEYKAEATGCVQQLVFSNLDSRTPELTLSFDTIEHRKQFAALMEVEFTARESSSDQRKCVILIDLLHVREKMVKLFSKLDTIEVLPFGLKSYICQEQFKFDLKKEYMKEFRNILFRDYIASASIHDSIPESNFWEAFNLALLANHAPLLHDLSLELKRMGIIPKSCLVAIQAFSTNNKLGKKFLWDKPNTELLTPATTQTLYYDIAVALYGGSLQLTQGQFISMTKGEGVIELQKEFETDKKKDAEKKEKAEETRGLDETETKTAKEALSQPQLEFVFYLLGKATDIKDAEELQIKVFLQLSGVETLHNRNITSLNTFEIAKYIKRLNLDLASKDAVLKERGLEDVTKTVKRLESENQSLTGQNKTLQSQVAEANSNIRALQTEVRQTASTHVEQIAKLNQSLATETEKEKKRDSEDNATRTGEDDHGSAVSKDALRGLPASTLASFEAFKVNLKEVGDHLSEPSQIANKGNRRGSF